MFFSVSLPSLIPLCHPPLSHASLITLSLIHLLLSPSFSAYYNANPWPFDQFYFFPFPSYPFSFYTFYFFSLSHPLFILYGVIHLHVQPMMNPCSARSQQQPQPQPTPFTCQTSWLIGIIFSGLSFNLENWPTAKTNNLRSKLKWLNRLVEDSLPKSNSSYPSLNQIYSKNCYTSFLFNKEPERDLHPTEKS